MKVMHEQCPRCGGRWEPYLQMRNDRWVCSSQCGMRKHHYPRTNGVAYMLLSDTYQIYWSYWDDRKDRCYISLYRDGTTIDLGSMLPYDVGDDVVKMLLVFS